MKPLWIGSNIGLNLELGELICSGRAGWVYEIKVITTPDKFTPELPPLVIKIAKQSEGRRVSEEAGVYEQLREFQGRFIPQSYGYFRRPVNLQELTVMPWDPTCTFPRSEDTFDIYNMPHPCASLNLFLMERLGPSLEDHDVEIRQDVDAITLSGDTPKDILVLRSVGRFICDPYSVLTQLITQWTTNGDVRGCGNVWHFAFGHTAGQYPASFSERL